MAKQSLLSNLKVCGTCQFWTGHQEPNTTLSYVYVESTEKAKCMGGGMNNCSKGPQSNCGKWQQRFKK